MAIVPKQILLVEDNPNHVELLLRAFQSWENPTQVHVANSLKEAHSWLQDASPDIAIIDWVLPDGQGSELLSSGNGLAPFPVVIMTSQGNEKIAVNSIKEGAIDYVVKNEHSILEMPRTVERALRDHTHILEKHQAEIALKETNQLLEQKVAERTAELTKINAALEQFAYVASHDLKEPLRMVILYLQLLEKHIKEKLTKDEHEFLTFAVDGAVRMNSLLDSILEYSRVRTNPISFREIDLEEVAEDVIHSLESTINSSGVTIYLDTLPNVSVDPNQIAQVFQNLIHNAIKFRSESDPSIWINSIEKEDEWEIRIRDNGIGIEPKYFDRIFQMFQRLHSLSRYKGSGIGLAICQGIIQRHGGEIGVESLPGEGTTFYFTLKKSPPG